MFLYKRISPTQPMNMKDSQQLTPSILSSGCQSAFDTCPSSVQIPNRSVMPACPRSQTRSVSWLAPLELATTTTKKKKKKKISLHQQTCRFEIISLPSRLANLLHLLNSAVRFESRRGEYVCRKFEMDA